MLHSKLSCCYNNCKLIIAGINLYEIAYYTICILINMLFHINIFSLYENMQYNYLFYHIFYIILLTASTPRKTAFTIPRQSKIKKVVLNIPLYAVMLSHLLTYYQFSFFTYLLVFSLTINPIFFFSFTSTAKS